MTALDASSAPVPDTRRWLPLYREPKHPLRLFCFPYAGGGAIAYRGWTDALDRAGIDLCAIQLPGRGNRFSEPPLTDLRQMARAVVDELGPLMAPPFAFFGHSMGATIAFEATRLLRRRGQTLPRRLVLSGEEPPHLLHDHGDLQGLSDEQFVTQVMAAYGAVIPAAIRDDPEAREVFLRPLRADLAAVTTYQHQPEPPLPCPITAFGGEDDGLVEPHTIAGWADHTTEPLQCQVFAGGHMFLLTHGEAPLRALVRALTD